MTGKSDLSTTTTEVGSMVVTRWIGTFLRVDVSQCLDPMLCSLLYVLKENANHNVNTRNTRCNSLEPTRVLGR